MRDPVSFDLRSPSSVARGVEAARAAGLLDGERAVAAEPPDWAIEIAEALVMLVDDPTWPEITMIARQIDAETPGRAED